MPPPITITVVVDCCLVQYLPVANKGGGIVKMRQKMECFSCHLHVTQKHKNCHQYEEGPVIQVVIVEPFHCHSTLLHLFGWVIGRDVVGHLWVVNVHCVLPDLYALRRLQNT